MLDSNVQDVATVKGKLLTTAATSSLSSAEQL